jgi:uncharacterized protein YbaR (Trm112 family)
MVEVARCPKCKSRLEIDEYKKDGEDKVVVFCSNEKCTYYNNPIVGIDKKERAAYITEALM